MHGTSSIDSNETIFSVSSQGSAIYVASVAYSIVDGVKVTSLSASMSVFSCDVHPMRGVPLLSLNGNISSLKDKSMLV